MGIVPVKKTQKSATSQKNSHLKNAQSILTCGFAEIWVLDESVERVKSTGKTGSIVCGLGRKNRNHNQLTMLERVERVEIHESVKGIEMESRSERRSWKLWLGERKEKQQSTYSAYVDGMLTPTANGLG